MKYFLFLLSLIILTGTNCWARIDDPLSFKLGLGQSIINVENPDGTEANYKGFEVSTQLFFPLYSKGSFHTSVTGGIRYFTDDNTANSDSQSESTQYWGPGVGLELSFYGLFVGTHYEHLSASHTSSGVYSRKISFEINSPNFYYGYRYKSGRASIGLSMLQMNSVIPQDASGLSQDSPWKNTSLSIDFTYDFSTTMGGFLESAFKK